jgi:indolepyruvate ferredoxin oxidoreductase
MCCVSGQDPRMTHSVALSDKYELPAGRVYMNGTQALVRLLLAQKARDEAAGLNTEGFVSGYRGSPLGAVDQELWKNRPLLEQHKVRFQPGLNEELAATAVWGTQMVSLDPKARVDGVFALWYGKGPGVDRSGDVFKHGNIAGGARHGGVLLVAGDDHACKSSSLPHQSEHAFIAAMIPVLHPSGVNEFIEFGLHGYAMSRYSGCWVGFKVISDTVESSSSFDIDPMSVEIKIPDSYPIPASGFSIRWPDPPLEQENRLQRERLYALLEYVRLNKLNRQDWVATEARLGICTTGKSYLDVREALLLLGLDEEAARGLGLRLLKIGVVWPLEPTCVVDFALGLDEILVVEEKRQVLEYQIKEHLYNEPHRPRVVGKFDESGEWVQVPSSGILLSPNGELTPAGIADVMAARMAKVFGHDALPASVQGWIERHAVGTTVAKAAAVFATSSACHIFCAGCPHNTSRRRCPKVRVRSRASAVTTCPCGWTGARRHSARWVAKGCRGSGRRPTPTRRMCSSTWATAPTCTQGSLAIRASVAAGVNITYKLLVNDAVAMTGGQPVEGAPSACRRSCSSWRPRGCPTCIW